MHHLDVFHGQIKEKLARFIKKILFSYNELYKNVKKNFKI